MAAKEIERAAHIAAYRIVQAHAAEPDCCIRRAQRSHPEDRIADIIREVFDRIISSKSLNRIEQVPGPRLVNHRRSGVVLELPVRTYFK